MRQRMGSLLWRSLGVLLALVVLFQVAFLLYFRDFYGSAEKAFWVPGLSGEFVPQGMDRLQGGFVLSGYLAGSGAARLYLVEADGSARLIRLRTKSGHTLISHAGGVAVSGSFVYLAGGNGQCYVFAMEDVLDPRQTAISVVGSFRTGNRASFCCMWGAVSSGGGICLWSAVPHRRQPPSHHSRRRPEHRPGHGISGGQ